MMTIEERDTARAIQAIACKLREPAQIDWEARKWEIAKALFVGGINHPDEMVRHQATTEREMIWIVEQATKFIEIYKKSQTNKTE